MALPGLSKGAAECAVDHAPWSFSQQQAAFWDQDLWQHTISDLVHTPASGTGQPWGHSHVVGMALSSCIHM